MDDIEAQKIVDEVYRILALPAKDKPTIHVKEPKTGAEYGNDENKIELRGRKGFEPESFSVFDYPGVNMKIVVIHETLHFIKKPIDGQVHYGGFFRLAAKLYRYFGIPKDEVDAQEVSVYPEAERYVNETYAADRRVWFVTGSAAA